MSERIKINIFFLGIPFYVITILLIYFLLPVKLIPDYWLLGQSGLVVYFFTGIILFYRSTIVFSTNKFIKTLVFVNIIIKLSALILTYLFLKEQYGVGIITTSDYYFYYSTGIKIGNNILNFFTLTKDFALSDTGAFIYYGAIYFIFGNSIFFAGLVNLFFATWSVVLLYKIIQLIDTDKVARLSAVIMSLIPILNFYVGIHLKEIIFIWTILFTTYQLIISFQTKNLKLLKFILISLLIIYLFTFRTVIAIFFILSIVIYLFWSKNISLSLLSKIGLIFVVGMSMFVFFSVSSAGDETDKYYQASESDQTILSYNVIKKRGKNSIASSFIGLPPQMIMTLTGPYPTFINTNLEKLSKITHYSQIADTFVKSFLSFFFILCFFDIRFVKKNIFFASFNILYIITLSIGGLSLLYRMFLPILPFYIYFASVGISKFKSKNYLIFTLYLIGIIILYVYFNYSKVLDYSL